MRRDQARLTETWVLDGMVRVRLTDCMTGDVVCERIVNVHAFESLSDARHELFKVAKQQHYEVVQL